MLAPQATTRPRQPPKMIFICKLRLFELRGPQAQISALHLLRINAVCKTARAVASPGRGTLRSPRRLRLTTRHSRQTQRHRRYIFYEQMQSVRLREP